MKKVRKKGLSGATAVVTPLIYYPLEHSPNATLFFIFQLFRIVLRPRLYIQIRKNPVCAI